MAERILVQCRTTEMPGAPNEKIDRMAESACQKVWKRGFDYNPGGDRLTSFGGFLNPKCTLLIDHGAEDAQEYNLRHLLWNGKELCVLMLYYFLVLIVK